MELLQRDARVGIWLPDPDNAEKTRNNYLFGLVDDYSRRIHSSTGEPPQVKVSQAAAAWFAELRSRQATMRAEADQPRYTKLTEGDQS